MGDKRSRRSKGYSRRKVLNGATTPPGKAKGRTNDSRLASLFRPVRAVMNSLAARKRKTGKDRIQWSTLPGIFVRVVKTALTVLLAVVVATVLFSDVFKKDAVLIGPFHINSELQAKGFDEQVLAGSIAHNISVMVQEADSIKQAKGFDVPSSLTLPDMQVPATNISARNVMRYVQEFAPLQALKRWLGFKSIRVGGNAILQGDEVLVHLRIVKDDAGGDRSEVKTFSRDFKDVKLLIDDISQYVMTYAEPYVRAAYLYRQKRMGDALAQLEQCQYIDPQENKRLVLNLGGVILIEQGKYDEAIAKFEAALRHVKTEGQSQELAAAYNNWGLALVYKCQARDAVGKFEEALRLDPKHALAYNNYGQALLAENETDKAVEKFEQALLNDPRLAIAYYNMGLANWEKDPGRAASLFTKSINLDEKYSDAYNALGLLQATALSPPLTDEAIKNLREAVRQNPNSGRAHANLGSALMNNRESPGVLAEAIEVLDKAVALYRSQGGAKEGCGRKFTEVYSKAHNDLAWAYEEAGEYRNAVTNYEKSFEIDPSYHYALTGKGDALRKAREFDAAMAVYEGVIQEPAADSESRNVSYRGQAKVFLARCGGCSGARKRTAEELALSKLKNIRPQPKDLNDELREAEEEVESLLKKSRQPSRVHAK